MRYDDYLCVHGNGLATMCTCCILTVKADKNKAEIWKNSEPNLPNNQTEQNSSAFCQKLDLASKDAPSSQSGPKNYK